MEGKRDEMELMKNNRVAQLQRMLSEEKREILKRVSRHNQNILNSSNDLIR
jgi:hypothetical protein